MQVEHILNEQSAGLKSKPCKIHQNSTRTTAGNTVSGNVIGQKMTEVDRAWLKMAGPDGAPFIFTFVIQEILQLRPENYEDPNFFPLP